VRLRGLSILEFLLVPDCQQSQESPEFQLLQYLRQHPDYQFPQEFHWHLRDLGDQRHQ